MTVHPAGPHFRKCEQMGLCACVRVHGNWTRLLDVAV